ncbi:MAG TPA: DUF3152 domain-containing protein [Micromonosporaceae bacterium]
MSSHPERRGRPRRVVVVSTIAALALTATAGLVGDRSGPTAPNQAKVDSAESALHAGATQVAVHAGAAQAAVDGGAAQVVGVAVGHDDAGPAGTTETTEVQQAMPTTGWYAPSTIGSGELPQAWLVSFGVWRWSTTYGPVLGTTGSVRKYRVAVEAGLPVTAAQFTSMVDATLGDARSWVAGKTFRFQHVPYSMPFNFTIYLAKPQTAYWLCAMGGLDIRVGGVPYTSCRVGRMVVINADRYFKGVPNYGASLTVYRQYVINHEVGHWLGHGHVYCPGTGLLAPVMQQQTLSLQGCRANGWPYVNGKLYN